MALARFWKANKITVINAIVAMLETVIDNYWVVFTDTPVAGKEGDHPGVKAAFFIGTILLEAAKWGLIGQVLDRLKESYSGEKYQIVGALLGTVSAVVKNYWVITDAPMAGNVSDSHAFRLFYFSANTLAEGYLWSGVGKILNYALQQISGSEAAPLNDVRSDRPSLNS